MKVEILLCVLIACAWAVYLRQLSGQKNGVFYAKGLWVQTGGKNTHPDPPLFNKLLLKVFENLHYNETPSWYARAGVQFFLLFPALRLYHKLFHSTENIYLAFIIPFAAAVMITMGCSAFAGVRYQGYINVGSGLPYIDPNEKSDSEFAWGKISKWWKRFFSGRGRVTAKWLGLVSIAAGIIIGFILPN